MSDQGPGAGDETVRKIRVHKKVRSSSTSSSSSSSAAGAAGGRSSSSSGGSGAAAAGSRRPSPMAGLSQSSAGMSGAAMDRRIAEIVPGLADLSLSPADAAASAGAARSLRLRALAEQQAAAAELLELDDIYDFSTRNAVDGQRPPPGAWSQAVKPPARKIVLSPYQYEMINYQRMLMRKNIWYYRDRMSVPRGPCPLHVLKDAWVQGIVDENTLVWGQGLIDWLPMKNVKLLVAQVRTPEVRFGAWVKRTFSLKPALERIREARREQRNPEQLSMQVERMR